MKLNIFGSIFVFLIASYPGLIISILSFFVSIIILIVKRKILNNVTKIVLSILAIISAFFIGISIYIAISFGGHHSVPVIGEADGPTAIYISGSNNNETIFLEENDITIIANDNDKYEIEIRNNDKIKKFMEINNPRILLNIKGETIIAKGHPAHSSSYPDIDSEYYFLADLEGRALFIHGNENIITIFKMENEIHPKKIYIDKNKLNEK